MGIRCSIVTGIFIAAYSFLLFNIYDLQLSNGQYYKAKAASQEFAASILEARRGIIYFTDKNGEKVGGALNKEFPVIYGVPKEIESPKNIAKALAPILEITPAEIIKKLSKPDDAYEILAEKITPTLANKIESLNLKGIYVTEEERRAYPFGTAAAHLLGFVGPDSKSVARVGHYGLEELYQERLAGTPGKLVDDELTEPTPGTDLTLTIDANIQIEAEKILENLVTTHKARGGSVIVEDPITGKIVSMASWPNFNPNSYSGTELKNFLNPAVQEIYEPGSIFKVITMAAGIDSLAITPETTYIDKGSLTMNGRTIQNYDLKTHGPYGKTTMTEVIEHSINTGAVFAERQIGRETFRKYLERFGFNDKTGVDMQGEVKGDLRRLSPKEKDIAFATASYGQGVAVTPIALINSIAAIANGGNLMRPYVNAELEPKIISPAIIRTYSAKQVTDMMISAVDKADVAKIKGYILAGKTGTAYVPDFKKGGYTDRVINTYVGFGPVSNPKFVILIKLDEPEGSPVAALTVVPAFRDLAQFVLNYYALPPDRIE